MLKTALVTGGTRGIGHAIVTSFLQQDMRVISTYHHSAAAAHALVEKYGADKLTFLPFDQGNLASHKELLLQINQRIDILVNNAGVGSQNVQRNSDVKEEQDEILFRVNALGPLWLSEALLPRMRQQGGGKIINIASVGGGIFHYPGFRLADGMSKAAVTFMTRQLAAENVHSPVDIFAICPGATDTDMFNASTLSHLNSEQRTALINQLPKRRLIEPQEIAQLCLFLTSEAAQILHGAVIDCSQGLGVAPGTLKP